MNGYVVVDASLAIKWVLKEPYADKALALASEWAASTETKPAAPCLLLVEATNALHRSVVQGTFPHLKQSSCWQGSSTWVSKSEKAHRFTFGPWS